MKEVERAMRDIQPGDLIGKVIKGKLDPFMSTSSTSGRNVDLTNVVLREADLSGAVLEGVNLSGVDLSEANLTGARMSQANLSGANMTEANLSGAILEEANLSGSRLGEANLEGARLEGANLSGANAGEANLSGAGLKNANLTGINLREANLEGCDLRSANAHGANFGEANLSGARLGQTNLQGANLGEANLEGAHMEGASLVGANLGEANLQGVNLSRSSLQFANLSESNLEGASLQNADLTGANLSEANLNGANVSGARYDLRTAWPDGFDPVAHGALHGNAANAGPASSTSHSHSFHTEVRVTESPVIVNAPVVMMQEAVAEQNFEIDPHGIRSIRVVNPIGPIHISDGHDGIRVRILRVSKGGDDGQAQASLEQFTHGLRVEGDTATLEIVGTDGPIPPHAMADIEIKTVDGIGIDLESPVGIDTPSFRGGHWSLTGRIKLA